MIVGDLKPVAEIVSAIKEYKQVLVLGCGSCVTVCLSGGEREAEQLSHELARIRHYQGTPPKFEVGSILRQCEEDLVRDYQTIPAGTDAILSLACGAGVQTLADAFDPLPGRFRGAGPYDDHDTSPRAETIAATLEVYS